jgi:hypothetical protein
MERSAARDARFYVAALQAARHHSGGLRNGDLDLVPVIAGVPPPAYGNLQGNQIVIFVRCRLAMRYINMTDAFS